MAQTQDRVNWRIYYADGSTYSDRDGDPFDAPGLGVLLVRQRDREDPAFVEVTHGDGPRVIDYFWYEDETWLGGDFAGLIQYLAEPGPRKVLVGRNVPSDTWRAAWKRAIEDALED